MKIKLSDEEKKRLELSVIELNVARTAFREASLMVFTREKTLWREIHLINKDAIKLSNPEDSDWEITVRENEGG